jgi:hypothetical protein
MSAAAQMPPTNKIDQTTNELLGLIENLPGQSAFKVDRLGELYPKGSAGAPESTLLRLVNFVQSSCGGSEVQLAALGAIDRAIRNFPSGVTPNVSKQLLAISYNRDGYSSEVRLGVLTGPLTTITEVAPVAAYPIVHNLTTLGTQIEPYKPGLWARVQGEKPHGYQTVLGSKYEIIDEENNPKLSSVAKTLADKLVDRMKLTYA